MEDLEKVIKALEECVKYDYSCKKCPYKPKSDDEEKDCSIELTKDALELLKEYAVIKETISDEIHETAKMFRRPEEDG